jgi:hypothetical protein
MRFGFCHIRSTGSIPVRICDADGAERHEPWTQPDHASTPVRNWRIGSGRLKWADQRSSLGRQMGSIIAMYPAGDTFDLAFSLVTALPRVC